MEELKAKEMENKKRYSLLNSVASGIFRAPEGVSPTASAILNFSVDV